MRNSYEIHFSTADGYHSYVSTMMWDKKYEGKTSGGYSNFGIEVAFKVDYAVREDAEIIAITKDGKPVKFSKIIEYIDKYLTFSHVAGYTEKLKNIIKEMPISKQ